MCQTFVLKLTQMQEDFTLLCDALVREPLVVEGCYPSAFAIVQLCTSSNVYDCLYVALTTSQPRDFDSFACKLKTALASKAPLANIEWVKHLSVRLQRLFGWGDASRSSDLTECQLKPRSKCIFSWVQSADRPAPFYVVDLRKISSAEKLLWLRQELGEGAPLRIFALKFIELFGSKIHGKGPQKRAILELYAPYSNTAPVKETDLAPAERAMFRLIWGETDCKRLRTD